MADLTLITIGVSLQFNETSRRESVNLTDLRASAKKSLRLGSAPEMFNKHLFDRRYGDGAFARLRSMLDDPEFAYRQIGSKFGLTLR